MDVPVKWRPADRVLRANLFYPVALSTALCGVLLAGRVVLSGTWDYRFLAWNLFLAWLPYLFAVWAVNAGRGVARLTAPVGLWLLFLPNSPYIMTDFVHLRYPRAFPPMYDTVMVFAFAWTGLLLGLTSLELLRVRVARRWGAWAAATFVVTSTVLTGAGIYIGRVMRWNSWEVLTYPQHFVQDVLHAFSYGYALAHTAVFALVVLVCYLTYLAMRGERGAVR